MPEVVDGVLLSWNQTAESWKDMGWTFTLKLTSLNTMKDIEQKIVNPIVNLFQGKNPKDFGLDQLDGVIHYVKTGSKEYRIVSAKSDSDE